MKKETNETSNNKKRNGLTTLLAILVLIIGGYFGGDQLLDQRADVPVTDDTVISEEYTEDYYEEAEDESEETEEVLVQDEAEDWEPSYRFRSKSLLNSHYEKHGEEMGFDSAKAYEEAASKVVENENSLQKVEEEDGDRVYYLESSNEFVIVSTDGYIRTYFYPEDGLDYYNRQ